MRPGLTIKSLPLTGKKVGDGALRRPSSPGAAAGDGTGCPNLKLCRFPSSFSLPVEWRDCSWVPAILERARPGRSYAAGARGLADSDATGQADVAAPFVSALRSDWLSVRFGPPSGAQNLNFGHLWSSLVTFGHLAGSRTITVPPSARARPGRSHAADAPGLASPDATNLADVAAPAAGRPPVTSGGTLAATSRGRNACAIIPLLPPPPVSHTVPRNLTISNPMKTISHSPRRLRAGFTLVELLVVIAIIGILAGMSLAVIPKVMSSAKKSKAKMQAQDIVTAIQHYDSVYGRFPVSAFAQTAAGGGDFTYGAIFKTGGAAVDDLRNSGYAMTNSEVIAILMDYTNYPNSSVATVNANYQKNPQKIAFLSANMPGDPGLPGVGPDLVYRDPWGNPYVITMDLNYDESCWDAFYGSTTVSAGGLNGLISQKDNLGNAVYGYHGKVMVWSAGPDGKIDPASPANQGVNKDNVLSW